MATEDEQKPQIISVTIKLKEDPYYPDFIGTFSKEPESKFAINHRRRQGHPDELEWFNPACAENRADAERAYLEIMPIVRGQKWMMRVTASAKVRVPCGNASVVAEVKAPYGIDGIDDEDEAGRREGEADIKEALADELKKLGFSNAEIAEAMSRAEVEGG